MDLFIYKISGLGDFAIVCASSETVAWILFCNEHGYDLYSLEVFEITKYEIQEGIIC